jgi:hypothetical protein
MVLFHCVAVLVPVGVVLGIFQDVMMHGFMRNPMVRALRFQLKGGPHGWFETNVHLATRVFAFASGSASLAILALACVARASARIREPALIALASVGGLIVAVACSIFVALAAGWIASYAFSRVPAIASPGAATLAAGLLFIWPLQRAVFP